MKNYISILVLTVLLVPVFLIIFWVVLVSLSILGKMDQDAYSYRVQRIVDSFFDYRR
jgi:hypothetical protein